MLIMEQPELKILQYSRIGEIIPKNEVTIVVGLPSVGKTHTLIKFLNSELIEPIVINLDESPHDSSLKSISIAGKHVLDLHKYTDLKDKVVIIDTYQLMMDEFGYSNTEQEQKAISKELVAIAHEKQVTLIILCHTADFASKEGIFIDNPFLVRDCAEQLIMQSKQTNKAQDNTVSYSTTVKKARGIGGTFILDNWMRTCINP